MSTLHDQPARDRVERDTAATLFVEAGAGTGKTHALVRRLSTLLLTDGVPVDRIAAITFTEKAAAELRDRLRVHLVDRRDGGDHRADAALAGLDTAAIGTLHSFALRLLSENPLEAGIPPKVTAQQDTAEATAVEAMWQECASVLFGGDRDGARSGILAQAVDDMLDAGVGTLAFREIVEALHRDWDRLPRGPLHSGGVPGSELPATPDLAEIVAAIGSIIGWRESCQDETDKLYQTLSKHEDWLRDLQSAAADPTASPTWVELLAKPLGPGSGGKGPNWGGADTVRGIKEEIKRLPSICTEVLSAHWRPRIAIVLDALIPVIHGHAEDRRRRGTLQFHDQLVLARELLQDPAVRDRVRSRYTRILIDEFQDTDPIQLDLAVLLTAEDGRQGAGANSGSVSGPVSGPVAGRLFTVGDPKQSVYRFRRADISTYLRAQRMDGVELERLTTNFRCSRAVLDWVNSVFSEVMLAAQGVQPGYQELEPGPDRPPHDPAHGPRPFVFRTEDVPALPDHCPADANDDLTRHWTEASDVTRVIATAVREQWTHESKDGGHTPLRLGDIAILLPSRGSLPMIEKCLDHAGIDFRTEASSIVYGTPEIRDLLLAVRAVANAADEASLVGALRSPLFGCGDDDLLRWRAAGGAWAPGAPAPDHLVDSPVAVGIDYLSGLSRRSRRPGEILEALVHDRMVFESVAESPRRRDLWRRIRFVIEHAWQWEDSAADPARADLREYADWALALTAEDARVPEAAIPEIGVDAVRITTIHAAKGLEYPMVVLAGMSRKWPGDRDRLLWTDDEPPRPAASFSTSVRDPGFARAAEREAEHSLAERIRLLYVAATRAESRLAVSGHGYVLTKETNPKPRKLWGSLLGSVMEVPDAPQLVPYGQDLLEPAPAPPVDVPGRDEWNDRSREVVARSAERAGWSATRIAHHPAGGPDPSLPEQLAAALWDRFAPAPTREEELPPAPRTVPLASGPDVGTAVHHLAEHTDLAELAAAAPSSAIPEWESWAADQLTALGLGGGVRGARSPEAVEEMVAVARTALTSDPVRRAAVRPHWAELPVAGSLTTADGTSVAVEGVVDLVVDHPDGSLSVIDYKTDVAVTCATVDDYLLQLCAYAELLGATTGRTVSRVDLVFCRGGRATVIGRDLS
ncbi:DNA helicase UvrD [Dietzia natronolimnaea]|uniref:DNA 3'-5' helicase n=1 Tax=Dietzia natronolimnaea TaxID=161920 RepID=A0A2A2WS28_9ACTN|nr:UvrD-helicase domain-containing protein [Dietzia natronolimnaea]PAY23833.1 DNA helicase UvrD [Dietzia natronolimnaea]